MKQLLFFATVILLSTSSCHQLTGSGNIITQDRSTGSFEGVSAGGSFEVEVVKGPSNKVTLECDDNLLKYIKTTVTNGVLKISTETNTGFNNAHLKVYIVAPVINFINASGAASIKSTGELKNTDKITIETSGAAHVNATVDAPIVDVEASGASNIELRGRTRQYTAKASGSADLKTTNLQSENADVSASGAASAHVHASVSLVVDASGAATIHYRGAGTLQQKLSGAASIKQGE